MKRRFFSFWIRSYFTPGYFTVVYDKIAKQNIFFFGSNESMTNTVRSGGIYGVPSVFIRFFR